MMKCTNEISEMSFFSTILAILRGQPQNGLVVLSEAWWSGQTRENVSAGTRISVLPSRLWSCEDRICYFVPPKTFIRDKTLP